MEFCTKISKTKEYDVIVAGSGPAGMAAAIMAARQGVKTLIVESLGRLGGISTSGMMSHFTGTKIYCLGNFFYDNRIVGEDCYFDKPLYDVVFHLSLTKDEQGRVTGKQSFSIYTTMTDEKGMPVVVNAADVYSIKPESHLRLDILRYANLFVGEEKYKEVQERYEI